MCGTKKNIKKCTCGGVCKTKVNEITMKDMDKVPRLNNPFDYDAQRFGKFIVNKNIEGEYVVNKGSILEKPIKVFGKSKSDEKKAIAYAKQRAGINEATDVQSSKIKVLKQILNNKGDGSEPTFYDILDKIEVQMGNTKYRAWLSNIADTLNIKYRTHADLEEKLYKIAKSGKIEEKKKLSEHSQTFGVDEAGQLWSFSMKNSYAKSWESARMSNLFKGSLKDMIIVKSSDLSSITNDADETDFRNKERGGDSYDTYDMPKHVLGDYSVTKLMYDKDEVDMYADDVPTIDSKDLEEAYFKNRTLQRTYDVINKSKQIRGGSGGDQTQHQYNDHVFIYDNNIKVTLSKVNKTKFIVKLTQNGKELKSSTFDNSVLAFEYMNELKAIARKLAHS